MHCQYFNRKIFKSVFAIILAASTQIYVPYLCFAEQKPPSENQTSDTQKLPPNNDNNSQNNQPTNNNQGTSQNIGQQEQVQPPQQPESKTEPPSPPVVQNENPSVKSKKVPAKKKSSQVKKEENNKPEPGEEKKEENKISLPDVLPDDISPPNSVSPTYNNEQQGNNFIKGIISWILIAMGVLIIIFVILSNRKIPTDSENLFQGKHDLKTKLKNSRSYDKNIRRK